MSDTVTDELIRAHLDQAAGFLDEAEEIGKRKKEWRAECKGAGLDPALIEKTAKLRREDKSKRDEQEFIMDAYKRVAGIE
ncbi:DUF2312 domain-containing protein [Epibacterium sp. DP7N7-1]|nr:DUF2312 domain-containing protein [Epibacterium sp. DP7N7-1]